MSLYCFEHARSPGQLAEMRRLEAAGICLFCPGQLGGPGGQTVVLSTAHWTVTPNEYPYTGTSVHLLLVPHEHASTLLGLGEEARADFWAALAAVADRYRLESYGLGVRNGDCLRTGATIAHVHAHLLVAAEGGAPVRMRFSGRGAGEAG